MNRLVDDITHEQERGVILTVLILKDLEDFPVKSLRGQLAAQGFPVDARTLTFHLNYLEERGYVLRSRLRSGRAEVEVQMVRATTKAVDLHDGRIAPDEGVKFQ
jgi:repressor of nif and glnA expression